MSSPSRSGLSPRGGKLRYRVAGGSRRQPYRVAGLSAGGWLPFAAALAVGAMLGLAVVVAGPVPALAGAAGLALLALAFVRPELVIVVVFALASGLLPSQLNPFVSLPVGSLQASDLLLLLLLGVVVVRVLVERDFTFRKTPLDVPMLIFFGTVLLGLGVAVFGFGVNFANATYELRMMAYYLLFFPVTNLVRTRAQVVRLINGLVAVAVLLAVLMLVTSAVGTVPGYTDSWALQEEGVARVFHPGYTVAYAAMMGLLAYSALLASPTQRGGRGVMPQKGGSQGSGGAVERGRELRWLLVAVLGLGVLSTLARNVIVSGLVSMGLLYVLLSRRERVRLVELVVFITILSVILVLGLVVAGEAGGLLSYADLYLQRIERMFSSDIVAQDENLQPRWEEIQYAWEKLQRYPILGIGLYNPYRPAFYRGEPPQLRHFLHNAYLALWIKTGLPGLLAFLWLSVLYLKRGFAGWAQVRTSPPSDSPPSGGGRGEEPGAGSHTRFLRAVMLGSVVAFVGLMLSNLVAPSFVQAGSLAVFGVMFGLNEAIRAVAVPSEAEQAVGARGGEYAA